MRAFINLLLTVLILSLTLTAQASACSSFTLRDEGVLIAGRNADGPEPWPGLVVVNNRGVKKTSRSFDQIFGGQDSPHAPLAWVSKYGSITFNYSAIEFPDGGMNEAGLVFQEMTMLETEFPADDSKPTIFMIQWIQQVLDTCATVGEVVENARGAVLDGWSWHFYVVDGSGASATIEFIGGEVVVHTGEKLRYPVSTNYPYAKELELLEEFEGFGGSKALELDKHEIVKGEIDARFAKGVTVLARYSSDPETNSMQYAWKTLDAMSPGTTQSAQVYDITNRRIELRSSRAPKIRSVRFDAFDFACDSPAMVLDLDLDLEGDVSDNFEPYSVINNSRLVSENLVVFAANPELQAFLEATGVKLESIAARYIDYPGTTSCDVTQ